MDYIVKKTVGELVKGKTPREVAKLTIVDPACGSGSFLLGAYQFLLDRHRDWYIEHLVPVLKGRTAAAPEVQALLPDPVASGKQKKRAHTNCRSIRSGQATPRRCGATGG